ncbi:MAG: transcriptional regulator [Opitutaceae bacterium]|jgi:nitrogen regulatory protein P-II 2|nr:transcriptional regulator [Opitutaceae bacterium]
MKVPLTLLTVVSESLLKEELLQLMREEGATGFTVTQADGEGTREFRTTEWEGPNVRIETILTVATADRILERLSADYFESYAIIAWLTDVSVLRRNKFEA